MTRVYVGMSGGVDSSLTAALLVEQGYDVTGVYMKNWTQDLPGMKCPWADDLADAKRVAVQLGIDFKVFDFETEYRDKVVRYMIDEYEHGRTPNPDIMCNQEVKFKLFLEAALEDGADMIATGHYARVTHVEGAEPFMGASASPDDLASSSYLSKDSLIDASSAADSDGKANSSRRETTASENSFAREGYLLQARDTNKDQTYFLYRVTAGALARTLFPLGEYTKPEVRKMAEARGLFTAAKKDSQGICFVGKIGIREFLSQYIKTTPGLVIDKKSGHKLGTHDGAIFYTLGQRHGLDIGGGLPYYVVGKDMAKNEVYVTTDLNDDALWKQSIELADIHWINGKPKDGDYQIRVRHRAPLVPATLTGSTLRLSQAERATTAGQSVVIYDGDVCLGGGIVVS